MNEIRWISWPIVASSWKLGNCVRWQLVARRLPSTISWWIIVERGRDQRSRDERIGRQQGFYDWSFVVSLHDITFISGYRPYVDINKNSNEPRWYEIWCEFITTRLHKCVARRGNFTTENPIEFTLCSMELRLGLRFTSYSYLYNGDLWFPRSKVFETSSISSFFSFAATNICYHAVRLCN